MQQESPRVVVAAVIERDGLILAARRTGPPALAGQWEFPGGKAEPGESDREALERECREELGVRIAVGERIGPEYPTPGGAMVVRTYLATIEDGEPQALESHDELAWVRPGTPEARALRWLDGDFLILDALDAVDARHAAVAEADADTPHDTAAEADARYAAAIDPEARHAAPAGAADDARRDTAVDAAPGVIRVA